MGKNSKRENIYDRPTLQAKPDRIFHVFAISLGILFSLTIVLVSPSAFADSHEWIIIENHKDCQNNSCLSEVGLIVNPGTIITWKNNDSTFHQIFSGNSDEGRNGEFESKMLLPGEEFSTKLNTEGYRNYYCDVHPWIQGVILVV